MANARRSCKGSPAALSSSSVRALAACAGAGVVAAYVARPDEPATADLIEGLRLSGVRVLLPVLRREPDWAWYTGPDGLIYTVYFEHNENVDAGSPLIGVCPPDQLQQIEEVVLKVQTEWQEQE